MMNTHYHLSTSKDTPNGSTLRPSKWDIAKVRRLVKDKFGKVACWWQVQIALGLYERRDIIGVAPTGSGKTLTFWLPTLMALDDGHQDKISFVVTPLNLLGKQNVQQLERAGIHAIAVSGDNSNNKTFDVCGSTLYYGLHSHYCRILQLEDTTS
jgi:superfamily II DNA helicase RecQ